MNKLLALIVLATGCASRALPPNCVQPATAALDGYALQPINPTGELSRTLYFAGGRSVEIGLAYRDHKHAKIVRLDRLPGGSRRMVELFSIPSAIAGVPPTVAGFDYMIDPGPKAADTVDVLGRFTVVASANAGFTAYTTIWLLTWNATAGTLDVGNPTTTTRDVSKCEVCDSITS